MIRSLFAALVFLCSLLVGSIQLSQGDLVWGSLLLVVSVGSISLLFTKSFKKARLEEELESVHEAISDLRSDQAYELRGTAGYASINNRIEAEKEKLGRIRQKLSRLESKKTQPQNRRNPHHGQPRRA